MNENKIAKLLRVVGIFEAACGFFLAFIISVDNEDLLPISAAVLVVALVNCLIFIAFGEVIRLLQSSNDKQDEMMKYMKRNNIKENISPRTILQDIESNLPKM